MVGYFGKGYYMVLYMVFRGIIGYYGYVELSLAHSLLQ